MLVSPPVFFVISSTTFSEFACILSVVILPRFRPNWLLRLLALLAITVSGGALANQYFLRLEQAPKLAKPQDHKQQAAKPTAALFEQKRLEHPVFADGIPGSAIAWIAKPKLEHQDFIATQNLCTKIISYRAEVSRAPPVV